MYKIILASQSPRRQELLKTLGYNFDTIKLDIDESYPPDLKANQITEFLAFKKSENFGNVENNQLVITADTIVWKDNKALEKPKDRKHAKEMLLSLSNNTHQVYTSVGFTSGEGFKVFTDCTEVHFLEISEQEIEFYLEKYNPLDKAGSYGIQDWIGLAKIDRINGSYFTVMGFPTHIVYDYLQKLI